MQVLMNRSLRACIGARRSGNVPSVGLWKEAQTLPICALAGARRARAYAKAMVLKTWLREMVLQPLRLTRARVGGKPQDQAGLALILRCRIGAFVTIPTLVGWKRVPQRFLEKCPFCNGDEPETLEHLVFRCGKWRGLRNQPHMAELIAKVRGLGPNFALGFGQRHLAWILGGTHAERGVHGWMPEGPTSENVQHDATTVAHTDTTDSSVGTSTSGDGSSLEWSPAGAITLARFLMKIVSLRANIIRSRWGVHASAPSDGVPNSSTGQRPDG